MPAFNTANSSAWTQGDQLDALRSIVLEPLNLDQLIGSVHHQGGLRWSSSIVQGALGNFGVFEVDGFQTRRPPRINPATEDSFILTWVRSGNLVQEFPDGTQNVVPKGRLHLYDTSQPCSFHWNAVHDTYLVLPRSQVVTALDGALPVNGVLPTPGTSIAPFLHAQLDLLARRGPGLGTDSLNSALDAATQLAVALLRESNNQVPYLDTCDLPPGSLLRDGLLAAARMYMRRYLHDHALTVEQIAFALHCSRARLYRCFAAHGSSIYAELREMRLQAARRRLEHSIEPIASLAWHCGFASASSFSRMFRARFGASPQEWRAGALQSES